ncbi:hypothetical protein YC2023_011560 [Brassica napus]
MSQSTIIHATIRANRLPTFRRRLTAGAMYSISDYGKPEMLKVVAKKKSSYLYDMDSDDEQCLVRIHERSYAENSVSYEITEDMFEKASYNQEADQGNATNQASSVKTYIARCYLDRYVLGLTIKYSLSLSILSEDNYMGFGFNKRPVMIMEMHVNISGPTKVDVGGNDS